MLQEKESSRIDISKTRNKTKNDSNVFAFVQVREKLKANICF